MERINRVAPFGRTYASIFNEYFGFLDLTIKKVHSLLTQELKDILSYGGADLGDIKDSPEVNVTDDMDFLDSWNKDDDLDLEKFVSSLDSKIGVFV